MLLGIRETGLIVAKGQLDHDTVKRVHFGGFGDDEEKEDEVEHSLVHLVCITHSLFVARSKKV